MDRPSAERLITDLYQFALGRKPGDAEYRHWVSLAEGGMAASDIVAGFYRSEEFQARRIVHSVFPPGHYHSPVVDPATVRDYVARERQSRPDGIPGLPLDAAVMRGLWLANLDFIRTTPFTDEPTPAHRYNYTGGPFPWGDAIMLRAILGHFRPRRVVEIGSGYSTACMLDSADHAGLAPFHVTCVEPYPERLQSLLRPQDADRITLHQSPIQDVSPAIVDTLEPNDILFIDSTHVMKTGSDVHYEFFHLLPRLRPGVIIHVHDVVYPFEYPDPWIFEQNYSWNETYVLRAFLMFNQEFRVLFWNSFYAARYAREVQAEFPVFLRNPGSSIWIRRERPVAEP
ncbi:MAG: class I SAM-dependent methyltransferase [Acetobacteraceae bacterium]|nr:class I SAM-dependent methyltransferase [Acetobacteraceae bacterium]